MFREPETLPVLARALRQLDYPLGKLDIKLVLEAGDVETIAVARTLGLEGVFEVIRVTAITTADQAESLQLRACNSPAASF